AISCLARIMLASPAAGLLRMVSNCAWVYVTEPSVSEVTGQSSGWLFQKPTPSGHWLPAVTVTVKLQLFEAPAALVAVITTVFVRRGKARPEGGVDIRVAPQPPVMVGVNVTVAVHLPGSGCVTMLLGQVMLSGVLVSTPKTSAVSVPLPAASAAVLFAKV